MILKCYQNLQVNPGRCVFFGLLGLWRLKGLTLQLRRVMRGEVTDQKVLSHEYFQGARKGVFLRNF